ncbi:Tfp pilus assembly protein FimT/FimU [Pyxidicoccus sp. 3LG]
MSVRRMRGVTLLEVMVTVAIAGFLVSMALVGMQEPINRQRETAATRELWASALRARQRAVASNQPVRFVVEDVVQPDGETRAVARWERLTCDNPWSNDSCPSAGCSDTTCRDTPACCDELGPELILPTTMNALSMHGLCYLPGTGRAVQPGNLTCMQGQLGNPDAIAAAAPGNLRFTFTSAKARTLLMVDGATGLSRLLDCDSQLAEDRPVAECAGP